MRVGVLRGGLEIESEKAVPPSQKLRVVSHDEIIALTSPGGTYSGSKYTHIARPQSLFLPESGSDSGLTFSISSGDENDSPKTPVLKPSFQPPSKK
jgi:hypothetical protein